ncbi:hypothetical protein ACW73L_03955 [Methylolobus aquaticus]
MRLNVLQQMLEGLYHVEVEHAVEDFVITDPDIARRLDESLTPRENREKLLVSQDGDEVRLALYLDSGILGCLEEDCPLDELHRDNFEDFLLALEGVSHFLYMSWNASRDRGVTLLELELQAEVDKYVMASSLFSRQRKTRSSERVWRCLFDSPVFDQALDGESRTRYADASHYAGRFCFNLENSYLKQRREAEMVTELRKFYRLSQAGKISHIHSVMA